MDIAAVVILYNPSIEVIKNIESYTNYVTKLYVVDNSENNDNELVNHLLRIPKTNYYAFKANKGIAAALNFACERASTEGFQWILTMDQDSYFEDSEFFDKFYAASKDELRIGIISASYTTVYDRWIKDFSPDFYEIHFVVTSGNILNLNAWKEVCGFEDKLFIDEVDHDFNLKLRNKGYLILTSKSIFLKHMIGQYHKNNLRLALKKEPSFNIHQPVRYYYMSRNSLFMAKKYFFSDFRFVKTRYINLLKMFVKILLLYPNKFTYLKFFFKGIKDFMYSNYGKFEK